MIIPIRCFTCNNVMASKYKEYKHLMNQLPKSDNILSDGDISIDGTEKTRKIKEDHTKIFIKIGVTRYCCKRHLIAHIDLIDKI